MPTSIDSNPFSLGRVAPAVGSPAALTANIPDFDCSHVNMILVQADPDNAGRCYFGTALLDPAAKTGVVYALAVGGDSFVLGSSAQNVYRLSEFRIAVDNPGDGAYVSVYVR